MKTKKIIVLIIIVILLFLLIKVIFFRDSHNNNSESENIIETETEAFDKDLKKVNLTGYHLVTYNQSANTNSVLKTLTVKMEESKKIKFVIGTIDKNKIVNERTNFEIFIKEGESNIDLSNERHMIKQGEYLFMDLSDYNILYEQENSINRSLVQNENNTISGKMIMSESNYILPFRYTLEKVKEYNTLFIGNNITTKNGGPGCDATDEEHDYYYLTKKRLENIFEVVNMDRMNGQDWENKRLVSTRKEWQEKNLTEDKLKNLDLIVFQLGDNYTPGDDFETGIKEMIEYVRGYIPNVQIIWMGIWFGEETRQNSLPGICERLGINFVNINDLSVPEYQSLVKEDTYRNDYVEISTIEERFYPNNKGMEIISNRLMDVLKFKGENK